MKVKVRATAVKGEKRKLANSQVVLWPVVDRHGGVTRAWGMLQDPFGVLQGPSGVYRALLGCTGRPYWGVRGEGVRRAL